MKNVLEYLEYSVEKYPQKVAYATELATITFKELEEQIYKIGTFLLANNQYKKPIVVFMEKEPSTIATYFGVISASCFYVPIDAEMPKSRIQLILDNVQAEYVICDNQTQALADEFETQAKVINYATLLETEADLEIVSNSIASSIDTDPIYIVFTSGTTGVPKGVVGTHRGTIDYIEQLSLILDLNSDTVFGNQTPLYLDACFKELFPTLKFGATTYLIPKPLFMQPVKLVEYLNTYKINTICWVVSALKMISTFKAFDTVVPEHLHTIAFGSEVFTIDQFKEWKRVLPEATFINLYGPTECTGMSCFYKVDRDFVEGEPIPIGKAFPNTEILLLEDGKLVTNGEQGEICIRGTSLTQGYYNNLEKTEESFVQNPLNTAYPELIYKTGDIGRYNQNGELLFVSRKDFQIKHMGHRIELGEVEANANMLDGVHNVAAIYDKNKQKIVLFYEGTIEMKEVKILLKEKLPRYMVPNVVKQLDRVPLTPNGKIDRVTLNSIYGG